MPKEIKYPSVEQIVEYNLLALSFIKAKKADQAKILSRPRLDYIFGKCKELEGDIYDKAAFLFINLIRLHPFASGNRRTAFIVTKDFLTENGEKFKIEDSPSQAKIMVGVRESYYTDDEIKEWIKNGQIKEFKRN